MKANGQGQTGKAASPFKVRQINKELMTPALEARIVEAKKRVKEFREMRRKRHGDNKGLSDNLARIRENCGPFAAWVTIARITHNELDSLSQEERIREEVFLEEQKQILRNRGCSSDDELIQLIYDL